MIEISNDHYKFQIKFMVIISTGSTPKVKSDKKIY